MAARDEAEHPLRELAQEVPDAGAAPSVRSSCSAGAVGGRVRHRSGGDRQHAADLDGQAERRAVGAGRGGGAGRDGVGALGLLDVDDPEAGQELLGLGERPVGHDRGAARADAHDAGLDRGRQPLGADELAGAQEVAMQLVGHVAGDGLGGQRSIW
ncbi:MAG: hypothetical protein U1F43_10170 [Myxococcota bacterium]